MLILRISILLLVAALPARAAAEPAGIKFDYFLSGAFFIPGLFFIFSFLQRKKDKFLLFTGLFCLLMSLRVLIIGKHLDEFFEGPFLSGFSAKAGNITLFLVPTLVLSSMNAVFPAFFSDKADKYFRYISVFIYAAAAAVLPAGLMNSSGFNIFIQSFYVLTVVVIIYILRGTAGSFFRNRNLISLSISAGMLIIGLCAISDILQISGLHNSGYLFKHGLIALAICGAVAASAYNSFSRGKSEYLSANFNIEVDKKTLELNESIKKTAELDRTKTNFFTNITHELRTPLTLILIPVENALETNTIPDSGLLGTIQKNGQYLLRLINNLLEYSKLESGHLPIEIRPINIELFVKSYMEAVIPAAKSKNISIRLESSTAGLNDLYVDTYCMDKILMNLFSNSLKYAENENLSIRLEADETHCHIYFEDTGTGIKNSDLEKVFTRFGKGGSESAFSFDGSGIGLALIKDFVELHGGRVIISSRSIHEGHSDHGTLIKISIPRGTAHFTGKQNVKIIDERPADNSYEQLKTLKLKDFESPPPGPRAHSDDELKTAGVLVVEDNDEMRNYIVSLLEKDYRVFQAKNGCEGLETAELRKPDAIITDILMPGMDGNEMIKKIKEHPELKDIPVLILSALGAVENRIDSYKTGADAYLVKPFYSRELVCRVDSLVKLHEYRRIISQRNLIIEQDLEIARMLQRKILPEENYSDSRVNCAAFYRPMDKVGGDFFDYIRRENETGLFIADVSGHGIPGAFLAHISRLSLEHALTETSGCAEIFEKINRTVSGYSVMNSFVTSTLCFINDRRELRYSSAGHHPMLVHRRSGGEFFSLKTSGGPLGFHSSGGYGEEVFKARKGDRILMYTDGLIDYDGTDSAGEGEKRLSNALRLHSSESPAALKEILLGEIHGKTAAPPGDDITFIIADIL